MPFAFVALILALGWRATPESRRPSLRSLSGTEPTPAREGSRADDGGLWIDPSTVLFAQALAGIEVDPRWIDELQTRAAALSAFRIDDVLALAELRDVLESVSFVERVPVLSASRAHGLEIELDLREPVACIPLPSGFLTVDRDGVVLSGLWPVPVVHGGAPLPIIGPMDDADGLFCMAQPGDWLSEAEHLDALDVACSLAAHLGLDERIDLGRVVIDATRARIASVGEPGIRLLLEGQRLVLFGRRPSCNEPGELPARSKWDSIGRALRPMVAHSGAGVLDWRTLDVRWDVPEIRPSAPIAMAVPSSASSSVSRDRANTPKRRISTVVATHSRVR